MKKPITIISSICSLLFLIALIWLGAGIYIDKKDGVQKADARYTQFLNASRANFSANPYGTPEFSSEFIRAIGNIDDFSVLKLEVNGELVYSYPPGMFSLPSPELVKSYSDSFTIGSNNYTVKASLYLMSPGSVYNHSRLSFLIILAGTILVGIFIVITSGSDRDSSEIYFSKRRSFKNFKKEEEEDDDDDDYYDEDFDSEEKQEDEPEEVTKEESSTESKYEAVDDFFDDSKEEATDDTSEEEDTAEEKTIVFEEEPIKLPEETPIFSPEDESEWNDDELFEESEEAKSEEDADIIDQLEQGNLESFESSESEETEKKDLTEQVSPITNLNLQANLEQKLDEAIVSELYVTLALTKINGLDRGNSISQNIISILKDSLPGGQIFEYKSDAYAVIMKGKPLQDSVDMFEKIYNKIDGYLKNSNSANEVSMGISASDNRDVRAERVILEAGQALDYASQDPDSPIVAFRANPQKYRELHGNQD